jgi:hypothetical protein
MLVVVRTTCQLCCCLLGYCTIVLRGVTHTAVAAGAAAAAAGAAGKVKGGPSPIKPHILHPKASSASECPVKNVEWFHIADWDKWPSLDDFEQKFLQVCLCSIAHMPVALLQSPFRA